MRSAVMREGPWWATRTQAQEGNKGDGARRFPVGPGMVDVSTGFAAHRPPLEGMGVRCTRRELRLPPSAASVLRAQRGSLQVVPVAFSVSVGGRRICR